MTEPPPFKAEMPREPKWHTYYRCRMAFRIESNRAAEWCTCPDCRLRFWHIGQGRKATVIVGIEPQDVPA